MPPNGFQAFRPLQPNEFFVVGVDPSHGGGDNTAVQFLSTKWLDVPIVYHSPLTITTVTPILPRVLSHVRAQTGAKPVIAYETNNGGDFELERLSRLNNGDFEIYEEKKLSPSARSIIKTGKFGWNTNTGTRPKMLRELKDAVEGEMLHVYHRQTVNEMFSFIISATGKPEAEENAHDDLVMALAIAWQLYQTELPSDTQSGGVVESDEFAPHYKEAGVLVVGGNE